MTTGWPTRESVTGVRCFPEADWPTLGHFRGLRTEVLDTLTAEFVVALEVARSRTVNERGIAYRNTRATARWCPSVYWRRRFDQP